MTARCRPPAWPWRRSNLYPRHRRAPAAAELAARLGPVLFVKPANMGSLRGREQGAQRGRVHAGHGAGGSSTTRCWWNRPSSAARSNAPCWATTTRRPACAARSCCAMSSIPTTPYIDEDGAAVVVPADISAQASETIRGGRWTPSARWNARAWRGRRVPDAGRPGHRQRGQHPARLHPHQHVPQAVWQASGMSYPELVTRLIELGASGMRATPC